jgi:hypothetical protein
MNFEVVSISKAPRSSAGPGCQCVHIRNGSSLESSICCQLMAERRCHQDRALTLALRDLLDRVL